MSLVISSTFIAVNKFSPVMRAMARDSHSFSGATEAAFQRADRAVNKYTSVLNRAQKELFGTLGAAAIAYKAIQAIEFGFDSIKNFDTAITKLQTNFRLSDSALIPFKKGIMEVANETYKAAQDVSEVYNIIGSKNRELLNQPDVLKARAKSAITLSEAFQSDLIPTASALTDLMAGFQLNDSAKTIDILAAASSSGAVKGLELTESLKSISAEALHAHVSLGQTAGMIEFINKKTQAGGEGSTAILRTFLALEKTGLAYKNGVFDLGYAIENVQKRMAGMKNDFAKNQFLVDLKIASPKTVKAARALFEPGSANELLEYQRQTERTGLAEQMAAKNTGTLAVAMERVKDAFGNALIEGTSMNLGLTILNNILTFTYTHMSGLLNIIGLLIGVFAIWKTFVYGSALVTAFLDTKMAVLALRTGICNIAIEKSSVALGVYKWGAMFAAEETGILSAEMAAVSALSFVGLIAGIVAVGYAFIKAGSSTKSAAASLEDYKQTLLAVNEAEAHKGDKIYSQYINERAAGRFKNYSYMQYSELINRMGNSIVSKNADLYSRFSTPYDEVPKGVTAIGTLSAINPKKAEQDAIVSRTEVNKNQKLNIDINNNTNNAASVNVSGNTNVQPNVTSTHGVTK